MFFERLIKKSDEELMLMISGGHERAFVTLYERYSRQMLRYFYRMLWKDNDHAQDCLQDLFVKIIEKPEYFNPDKKFSTWIYSVARNMCKNEYRKKTYQETFIANNGVSELMENNIHQQIDNKEFVRTLEVIMKDWDEDDRSLFVFRQELDKTFAEIAEILGCPEGTVKSRWFYLRKKLMTQLHEFQIMLK